MPLPTRSCGHTSFVLCEQCIVCIHQGQSYADTKYMVGCGQCEGVRRVRGRPKLTETLGPAAVAGLWLLRQPKSPWIGTSSRLNLLDSPTQTVQPGGPRYFSAQSTSGLLRPSIHAIESSEPEKRRYIIRNKDTFEPYAPPYHLPFLAGARLTAYELLAFLPNSLRSPDIVYRFASNGASRRAIWAIVNSARDLQKEWTPNQCGSILAQVMNRAGFEGWMITAHWDWHSALKNTWDESNLEVTGFKTLGIQREADHLDKNRHVPFKDLAVSVRRWHLI